MIPGYSSLLILLGRPGCIGHGHINGKFAAAAVRCPTNQSIPDGMCQTRLNPNLQGTLPDAPRLRFFPQPCPAISKVAFKAFLKDDGPLITLTFDDRCEPR